jgi:hypothetical protein
VFFKHDLFLNGRLYGFLAFFSEFGHSQHHQGCGGDSWDGRNYRVECPNSPLRRLLMKTPDRGCQESPEELLRGITVQQLPPQTIPAELVLV